MNYYGVHFPFSTTLIVKTSMPKEEVIINLHHSFGIESPSGAIYNPQSFLFLELIKFPDSRQKLLAKELDEVLYA